MATHPIIARYFFCTVRITFKYVYLFWSYPDSLVPEGLRCLRKVIMKGWAAIHRWIQGIKLVNQTIFVVFKQWIVVEPDMLESFPLFETYQTVVGGFDPNVLYHVFDAAYHLLKVVFSVLSGGIQNEAKFQIYEH